MWTGRILPWLLVPIGVTLAAASWSGLELAAEVREVRARLGQRVTWMVDIQALQEAAGNEPPPAERVERAVQRLRDARGALREALADDPEASVALGRLYGAMEGSEAVSPNVVDAGYPLVRALRRQSRTASFELDGHWDSLNHLVIWAVGLSATCMVLFVQYVIVRRREGRLWQALQRYSVQRLAVAEAQRGSAVARFRRDLQQVMEGLPVGVAVIDDDDVVRYANPNLARILCRDLPDDLVGTTLHNHEGLERSEPVEVEWDGGPASLVVLRDRAEKRAFEAQLRLADRLASIGTMASGVAHEINNPLTWIILDLDELAQRLAGTSEMTELVEPIQNGVSRIQQIVRDLSTFARGEAAPTKPTDDLAALLRSTARIVTSTLPHLVRIEVPASSGPAVAGPEARIGQVFLNLLVNAVEAVTAGATGPDPHVRVTLGPATPSTIVVAVSDDGPGIPESDRARIFDPFFTTKPVGEGTGLGLFICHQLIGQLGGRIEVESAAGAGATFRVTLPLADAPEPVRRPRLAPSLLVVDDDPLVGRAIARLLEPERRVVTVGSITEARATLNAAEFDAVMCALDLSDGRGWDLLPQLGRRLVLVLAEPPVAEDRARIDREGVPTLDKPVQPAELGAVVDHVLR